VRQKWCITHTLLVAVLLLGLAMVYPLYRTVQAQETTRLTAEKAQVAWQREGTDDMRVLPPGAQQTLHPGDRISIDGLGRGRLHFSNIGTVSIYHDSLVSLGDMDDVSAELVLDKNTGGTLYTRIQDLDDHIIIETPNARVDASGSVLIHYFAQDDATWVVVQSGLATVEASGQTVTVRARQQSWVEDDGAPVSAKSATRQITGARFRWADDLTNGAILETDLFALPETPPQSQNKSFLVILFALVVIAIIVGVVILGRRKRLQVPDERQVSRPDTTVAGVRLILGDSYDDFVALQSGVLTLGRAQDNALILADDEASSHHARIVQAPEGFIIEDLQSTNGTFVNDQRVTRQELQAGDIVSLGNTKLLFQSTGAVSIQSGHATPPPQSAFAGIRMVLSNGDYGEFVPLEAHELTIGRASDNNLVLKGDQVSSHHARILQTSHGYVIEDLQSTNGTLVDGERTTQKRLSGGEKIEIGRSVFLFVVHSEQDTPS